MFPASFCPELTEVLQLSPLSPPGAGGNAGSQVRLKPAVTVSSGFIPRRSLFPGAAGQALSYISSR